MLVWPSGALLVGVYPTVVVMRMYGGELDGEIQLV
jgi:hypothetical protein